MKIIAGNANVPLANEIVALLDSRLTEAVIRRFADNEIFVEILETVRGQDVFVIQPTAFPANDTVMELLILIDALKRGSAGRITAVLPYFGYARQDRKTGPRTPISAKLVANLVQVAGASRVLTIDLHAGQIQGFFDIPVDNLYAKTVFHEDIQKLNFPHEDVVMVSPDVGAIFRTRSIAKFLGVDLAIVDKRREKPGSSEVMNIVGSVRDKHCILVDDIVDSAGTLCNGARALMDHGAKSVRAYATHGVLSGSATERVLASPLEELVVTNSIMATEKVANCVKIRQISIAPLLAEAIRCISEDKSVSSLFDAI